MKHSTLRLSILFLMGALFFVAPVAGQDLDKDKDYLVTCVGFYNLENLFDTLDSEDTHDTEYTPQGKNKWDTDRYQYKLDNMAEVVGKIGTEVTPHGLAVFGVAEVENRTVLEDLANTEPIKDRNYKVVHEQSPDERGIDVGLLYQPKYFEPQSHKTYRVDLGEDDETREQLLVSGNLNGERVHFIVAHWPSRGGGQALSEPKRIKAAQVGRAIIDSLQEDDPEAKIMYMGDLNDDPINVSLQEHLKSEGKMRKVKDGKMFNPMKDLFDKGIGTLAWRDNWNLFDQILLSAPLLGDDLTSFKYFRAKVYNKQYLRQESGNFKGYPFRSFVGSTFMGGYSDHFPVYILLIREQ